MFWVEQSAFDVCLSVGVDLVGNLWRKEEKERRLSQKGKGFWFDSCKMVLFLGFGWGNFS